MSPGGKIIRVTMSPPTHISAVKLFETSQREFENKSLKRKLYLSKGKINSLLFHFFSLKYKDTEIVPLPKKSDTYRIVGPLYRCIPNAYAIFFKLTHSLHELKNHNKADFHNGCRLTEC